MELPNVNPGGESDPLMAEQDHFPLETPSANPNLDQSCGGESTLVSPPAFSAFEPDQESESASSSLSPSEIVAVQASSPDFWEQGLSSEERTLPDEGFSRVLAQLDIELPRPVQKPQAPELEQIGPYRIQRLIGTGGFGHVYEGVDPVSGNLVAIKIPRADRPQARWSSRELWIGQRIQHPNVVSVFHAGEQDGFPYLVSPYIQGLSLSTWLKQRGPEAPLSYRTAVSMLMLLARGIESCHRHGVIHRDLKPSNILLDTQSPAGPAVEGLAERVVPRICDFGLSRQASGEVSLESSSDVVAGTVSYMAPEQVMGIRNQTWAVDVYALGVLFYKLLTGVVPYRGKNSYEILAKIMRDEPQSPALLRSGLPRDLETICLKCLQHQPEQRYESAGALAEDLQAFLDGRPIAARAVSRSEKLLKWVRRRPIEAGIAALAVVSSLGLMVGSLWFAMKSHQLVAKIQEQDELLNWQVVLANRDIVATRLARAEDLESEGALEQANAILKELEPRFTGTADSGFAFRAFRNRMERRLSLLGTEASGICNLTVYPGPDEQPRLAIGNSTAGTLALWDPEEGRQIESVTAPFKIRLLHGMNPPRLFAFTAEFTPELVETGHALLHVFDPQNLKRLRTFPFPKWVTTMPLVSPLPGGRLLLADLENDHCEIRDATSFQLLSPLNPGGRVLGLVSSETGQRQVMLVREGAHHWLDFLEPCAASLTRIRLSVPNLTGTSEPTSLLSVSPDGRHLVLLTRETATLILVDLQAQARRTLEASPSSGLVCFSPGGRWLASRTSQGAIEVIDVPGGQVVETLAVAGTYFHTFDFSRDGRTLYTGTEADSRVWIWRLSETGRLKSNDDLTVSLDESFCSVAFAPDSKYFVMGGDHSLRIRSVGENPEPVPIPTAGSAVSAVVFLEDGRRLAVALRDESGTILICDMASGKVLRTLVGHEGPVRGLAVSSNGKLLASVGDDRTTRLWDLEDPESASKILGLHKAQARCVAFSHEGRYVAVGDNAHRFTVYDVESGEVLYHRTLPRTVNAVAFSPTKNLIAFGDEIGTIYLLTVPEFSLKRLLAAHSSVGGVQSLAFHPSGTELASGGDQGEVVLWDLLVYRELLRDRPHQREVTGLAFSPDGQRLVSVATDGSYRVLNAHQPRPPVTQVSPQDLDVLPPISGVPSNTPPPPPPPRLPE